MRVLSLWVMLIILVGSAGGADCLAAGDPPPQYYAEENVDFGVKPQRTLQTNVGAPTPMALPDGIAKTLSTLDLDYMIYEATASKKELPLLVDVLNTEHNYTIDILYNIPAMYIPYGGSPGTFTDNVQQLFAAELGKLTMLRTDFPIVFFCLGVRCWESYNAVLRAHHAGYRNLYWYRGGINAWMEAGFEVTPLY